MLSSRRGGQTRIHNLMAPPKRHLTRTEAGRAEVDMNFVMTAGRKLVEVQATAEHQVFDETQLEKMLSLAREGVQSLIAKQQAILGRLTLRQ